MKSKKVKEVVTPLAEGGEIPQGGGGDKGEKEETVFYHIYMQEVTKDGVPVGDVMDLEKDFKGLKYHSAKGLNDIGEAKNVYTETYADSDKVRVHMPDIVTNKATEVSLRVIFIGDNRQNVFYAFNDYISKGFHKFWDDKRKRSFIFYVKGAIKPSHEEFKGFPYIDVTYKLSNIYGKTFPVTE